MRLDCSFELMPHLFKVAKIGITHNSLNFTSKQELGECIPPPIWKFLAPPIESQWGNPDC